MKIVIKNFGPIDSIELELTKDLHLIYGENAIGKSYATYCVYCLLKNLTNKSISYSFLNSYNAIRKFGLEEKEAGPIFIVIARDVLFKLRKEKKSRIAVSKEVLDFIKGRLEEILLNDLENSLLNTFSSLKNLRNGYSNKNYEITLELSDGTILYFISDDEGKLTLDINFEYDLEIVEKNTKSTRFSLYQNKKKVFGVATEEAFIREFELSMYYIINGLLRALDFNIRDIYYLPASRSGLYQALNSFTPIIAELTQNRFFIQRRNIELPSLPEPLSDYFIDLSTVNKKNVNTEFLPLINQLQNEIIKGEVDFDENTKRITYKPKDVDIELGLAESSSMVAEMSPLILYLKHIINYKVGSNRVREPLLFDEEEFFGNWRAKGIDILFIEEPEAHLHPEVQITLMEVFSKLISYNIKLFITSHSNYMFNKINNIIIKKDIDVSKVAVYHLVRTPNGTRQNEEMVATGEGIMDDNFQTVSEKLYNERMNSLEEQNDDK